MIQKATKCYTLQSKTEPYLSDLANKMLTQSQQQRDGLCTVYMNMPTKAGEADRAEEVRTKDRRSWLTEVSCAGVFSHPDKRLEEAVRTKDRVWLTFSCQEGTEVFMVAGESHWDTTS